MTDKNTLQPDLTIQDTARLLACTPKHIWTLINEKALDSYKLGRVNRITFESFERLRQNGHSRHDSAA